VRACVRVKYCFRKQAVDHSGHLGGLLKNLELHVFATTTDFVW